MIIFEINNLIKEADENQNPSFYRRHKKKILAAGVLGALAAGTAAGYKGRLGPHIQKAISDNAFKLSAKVVGKGLKIENDKRLELNKIVGQKLTKMGAKGMASSGKKSLQARKILIDRGIKDIRDKTEGLRNELNSKFNINPFKDFGNQTPS